MAEKAGEADCMEAARTRFEQWRSIRSGKAPLPDELCKLAINPARVIEPRQQGRPAARRHPIYFLETFVDPERFCGTCYRAANWVVMGKTTGRGKQSNSYVPHRSIKEILGYPLTRRFRGLLEQLDEAGQTPPRRQFGRTGSGA